jgi:hypothetical protein
MVGVEKIFYAATSASEIVRVLAAPQDETKISTRFTEPPLVKNFLEG